MTSEEAFKAMVDNKQVWYIVWGGNSDTWMVTLNCKKITSVTQFGCTVDSLEWDKRAKLDDLYLDLSEAKNRILDHLDAWKRLTNGQAKNM